VWPPFLESPLPPTGPSLCGGWFAALLCGVENSGRSECRWGFLLHIRADEGTRSHSRLETQQSAQHPEPGLRGRVLHDMTGQTETGTRPWRWNRQEPPGLSILKDAGGGCWHRA